MPLGIGAAMLIGSAVSAGTAVAGAKIQSNAAKNAARSQQQATNQALQVQQRANQPYMDLGASAAQRLGQMAANPSPYTQVFGNGAGAQRPSLASLGAPQGGPMPPGMGQPPHGMGGPPQAAPGGGMVLLRAPDGSTRPFPAAQADSVIQQAAARGHQLQRVG